MMTYVVVEGPVDRDLLATGLTHAGVRSTAYHFLVAGGSSSAISAAASFLATRDNPVALVLDADSVDEEAIQTQRVIVEELIQRTGSRSPFLLLLASPATEALVFASPRAARELFGRRLKISEVVKSQVNPKELLSDLAKKKGGHIQEVLTGTVVGEAVAQSSLVKSLARFIKRPAAKKSHIVAA